MVAWVSVDPVRRKLDFYPKAISAKVEKSYNERDPWSPSACVLGSDFFNATVHFHPSGSCYQTTPGMSMGRAGFKQPGYRSVKRIVKPEDGSSIVIFGKQVHGEWRIAANEVESEVKFEASMPTDCLVEGTADTNADTSPAGFRAWRGEDLVAGAWDVSIVVWQWCRGVPERQGNLMALSDEWWCPYLINENTAIEAAFASGEAQMEIGGLRDREGTLRRKLVIRFTRGQSFALQRDESNERRVKERAVRRVVKTVQELKVMLDRMAGPPPIEPTELTEHMPAAAIPHHFFCPITQDVMNDPVKTADNMCYDRPAIETWFMQNGTSPLTGLTLSSKALTPNAELREQIASFVKMHAHLITPQATPQATPQSSSSNLLAAAGLTTAMNGASITAAATAALAAAPSDAPP